MFLNDRIRTPSATRQTVPTLTNQHVLRCTSFAPHQNEVKANYGIANFKCRLPTEKCSCSTRMCGSFFRSVGVWGDGGRDKGGKVLADWLDSRIKTDFNRDANYLNDRGNPSWLVSWKGFWDLHISGMPWRGIDGCTEGARAV